MDRFSALDVEDLSGLMGPENARNYLARHPEMAPGEEDTYPSTQPDPVEAATDPNATSSKASLGVPADEDDLGVAGLNQQVAAYQAKVQQLRKDQFEAAQAALKERRLGPSVSERLAQLSAAFAAPQYTRGFAGMMANVMPVIAKQGAAVREADDSRAEALRQLQEKYTTGQVEDEGTALTTALQLARIKAAMAKSGAAKWTANPVTGKAMALPGAGTKIHYPKSKAEFDAIPEGDFFWTEGMDAPVPKAPVGGM